MPVLIRGIKVGDLSLTRHQETGLVKISGTYQLMSEQDVVLATQGFNGYNDLKLEPSATTQQHINQIFEGVKEDLEKILGIKES